MVDAGSAGLVTRRLTLRPWTQDDASRLLDLYGRREVVRWLGDGPPRMMETLAQARSTVARWGERSALSPLGVWAAEITGTGVVAGTVLLAELPHDTAVEIAWHFHPDSWGHGYASEAAAALLAHGFALGLPEIWALTHLENERSKSVCRRLGLRHRGRDQGWYAVPMEVYSLTAEEYAGAT